MLGDVEADDFLKEAHTKEAALVHDKEIDSRDDGCPDDDHEHAKELPAKELAFILIVADKAALVVEDADSDQTPHAREAVHL